LNKKAAIPQDVKKNNADSEELDGKSLYREVFSKYSLWISMVVLATQLKFNCLVNVFTCFRRCCKTVALFCKNSQSFHEPTVLLEAHISLLS